MAMAISAQTGVKAWSLCADTRDALGASYIYMRSDDETQTRDLAEITYTRLLTAGTWIMRRRISGFWRPRRLRGNDFLHQNHGVAWCADRLRNHAIYFAATQRIVRAYGKGQISTTTSVHSGPLLVL